MRRWRDNLGHLLRSWLNCVLLREDALAQSAPHTYRKRTHTVTLIQANKLSVTYSMMKYSLWGLHSYTVHGLQILVVRVRTHGCREVETINILFKLHECSCCILPWTLRTGLHGVWSKRQKKKQKGNRGKCYKFLFSVMEGLVVPYCMPVGKVLHDESKKCFLKQRPSHRTNIPLPGVVTWMKKHITWKALACAIVCVGAGRVCVIFKACLRFCFSSMSCFQIWLYLCEHYGSKEPSEFCVTGSMSGEGGREMNVLKGS